MLGKEMLLSGKQKVGILEIVGASDEGFARVYLKGGSEETVWGFDTRKYPNDQVIYVEAHIATITKNMVEDSTSGNWRVKDIYKNAYLEFDSPF